MIRVTVVAAVASLIVATPAARMGVARRGSRCCVRSRVGSRIAYARGQHRGVDIGAARRSPGECAGPRERSRSPGTRAGRRPRRHDPDRPRYADDAAPARHAPRRARRRGQRRARSSARSATSEGTLSCTLAWSTADVFPSLGIRVAAGSEPGHVDPASLLPGSPSRDRARARSPSLMVRGGAGSLPSSAACRGRSLVRRSVSESAVATEPTRSRRSLPRAIRRIRFRGQGRVPLRAVRVESETLPCSTASDRAPEARPVSRAAGAGSKVRAPLARLSGCSARPRLRNAVSKAPSAHAFLPNRAPQRQQRRRRRRFSDRSAHAHSTGRGSRAGRPRTMRSGPPRRRCGEERYGAATAGSRLTWLSARRGGGPAGAHSRGRQEGCTYH